MTLAIVTNMDSVVVPWAERKLKIAFRIDACAIAVTRNGILAGAAIYHTFSSRSCEMAVASDGSKTWCSPRFLRAAFEYPFVQCGLARVTALIPVTNEASLAAALKLGFTLEGRMHEANEDGADLLVAGLLRRDCKWIEQPKEEPDAANAAAA